jgi:hypothetical protein
MDEAREPGRQAGEFDLLAEVNESLPVILAEMLRRARV